MMLSVRFVAKKIAVVLNKRALKKRAGAFLPM